MDINQFAMNGESLTGPGLKFGHSSFNKKVLNLIKDHLYWSKKYQHFGDYQEINPFEQINQIDF